MDLSIHDFKKGDHDGNIFFGGGTNDPFDCTSCCHIWTAWKGKFISHCKVHDISDPTLCAYEHNVRIKHA